MDVNYSLKRQKNNSCDLVDRISALPDYILGNILSLLPTKNAVATSLVSKRWKHVWMSFHSLDFCNDNGREKHDESEDMKFIRFVDSVLLHYNTGLLNKFNLVWRPYCISSHANSWITTAITRKVHELSLSLQSLSGRFDVPICVFNCNSLRSLNLDGHISISAAIVVFLPKLESLKLSCYFESEEAFEKLINGCPMLNYLRWAICYDYINDFTCIISSTSLRHLELHFGTSCSLKLEAPSLEYFRLNGFISDFLVQRSLNSVIEAEFNLLLIESKLSQADICNSIVKAVGAFDSAKSLTLSPCVIQALSHATIRLSTEFKRLVKLVAITDCCHCSIIRDFIQNSDNLEVLTISQYSNQVCTEGLHDHSNSTDFVKVPRCLSNSLKKVVIDNYYGREDICGMIGNILKHGSVLEVVKIFPDSDFSDSEKLKLAQEIYKFPKNSSSCEVDFILDAQTTLHEENEDTDPSSPIPIDFGAIEGYDEDVFEF